MTIADLSVESSLSRGIGKSFDHSAMATVHIKMIDRENDCTASQRTGQRAGHRRDLHAIGPENVHSYTVACQRLSFSRASLPSRAHSRTLRVVQSSGAARVSTAKPAARTNGLDT